MRQTRSCTLNYKVGDTLGGYPLLAECGKGAYGSVFLAENTLTKQQVVLKSYIMPGGTAIENSKD